MKNNVCILGCYKSFKRCKCLFIKIKYLIYKYLSQIIAIYLFKLHNAYVTFLIVRLGIINKIHDIVLNHIQNHPRPNCS